MKTTVFVIVTALIALWLERSPATRLETGDPERVVFRATLVPGDDRAGPTRVTVVSRDEGAGVQTVLWVDRGDAPQERVCGTVDSLAGPAADRSVVYSTAAGGGVQVRREAGGLALWIGGARAGGLRMDGAMAPAVAGRRLLDARFVGGSCSLSDPAAPYIVRLVEGSAPSGGSARPAVYLELGRGGRSALYAAEVTRNREGGYVAKVREGRADLSLALSGPPGSRVCTLSGSIGGKVIEGRLHVVQAVELDRC